TEVAALGALVTAADGPAGPVDNSPPLVVDEDDALVDAPVPEVVVVETASCAKIIRGQATRKNSANKTTDNRLISRVGPSGFEPRLEQETRKALVAVMAVSMKSRPLIVSAPVIVQFLS